MRARRLLVYGGWMLLTLAAGLVFRFAPLGLPRFAVKYGGSTMWALMIYWVIAAAAASWSRSQVVLVAGTIATAVEFLKLDHSPGLDAFRLTLPGVLLLGRYFAWPDIVAYWLAIGCGAVVDRKLIGRQSESTD